MNNKHQCLLQAVIFNVIEFGIYLQKALEYTLAVDLLNELKRFCLISVSFADSLGTGQRPLNVSNRPCWINIRLNSPLFWIERISSQLNKNR